MESFSSRKKTPNITKLSHEMTVNHKLLPIATFKQWHIQTPARHTPCICSSFARLTACNTCTAGPPWVSFQLLHCTGTKSVAGANQDLNWEMLHGRPQDLMSFGKIGVEWSQLKQAVCTEKYIYIYVRVCVPKNTGPHKFPKGLQVFWGIYRGYAGRSWEKLRKAENRASRPPLCFK